MTQNEKRESQHYSQSKKPKDDPPIIDKRNLFQGPSLPRNRQPNKAEKKFK